MNHKSLHRLLWPVFVVSAGVLGFEIALMRVLLVASWYHFAFLIISIALLGFGASGTALCFLGDRLRARATIVVPALVTATGVAMPVCVMLAQWIPVTSRFVPAILAGQIAAWVAYWALLTVPFLLGASAVGLALMCAGPNIPTVYGTNLVGSAAGAAAASLVMNVVAPEWLPITFGAVTVLGGAALGRGPRLRWLSTAIGAGALCLLGFVASPRIRVDEYKYQQYVDNLVASHDATRVARAFSPRADVAAYRGAVFHELPFLGPGETPPPLAALVADGHWVGSVLEVSRREDARVVDGTLMSFSYVFVDEPRVLLLGETGGVNVWIAERHGARSVRVVQPDSRIVDVVGGALAQHGGRVMELCTVTIAEPRHFVEHTDERFDLIQLAGFESWAAETGVAGLNQDVLVTVEGIAACMSRLSPSGVLAIGRGIQLPPRDNVKLVATIIAALRRLDISNPAAHIVVVRDFLGACTLVKTSPWTGNDIDRVRRACRERELTPVFFEGVHDDELNHPDRLPGPADSGGDWLNHAITQLLSSTSDRFVRDWPFNVRAPTDDRPFFANFGKLSAIDELMAAYGDLWLTRSDLAMLFVVAAIVAIAVSAAILIVLPLVLVREVRRADGHAATAGYFGAIGLAYLAMEMTMLSRLVHLIGDAVLTGAVVIAAFLVFSGIGSLAARRLPVVRSRWIAAVATVCAAVLALTTPVTAAAGGASSPLRIAVAVLLIAPAAVLMGFPMPSALSIVERRGSGLVPWVWGINGFASVLAPPVATLVAMTWGFRAAGVCAVVSYAVAALLFGRLSGEKKRGLDARPGR